VLRPLLHLVARLVERDPITDDTRFALTPAGEIVADLMRDDAAILDDVGHRFDQDQRCGALGTIGQAKTHKDYFKYIEP
jgi:hypothetical protein